MEREARCEKELKELITSKFNDITKENCDGFYRKLLGYIYTSVSIWRTYADYAFFKM